MFCIYSCEMQPTYDDMSVDYFINRPLVLFVKCWPIN